ncbi:hypothetical protein [Kribbella sp. NPDC051770]|uniref:hypothetical protein n=1 Tax=Kribbella sp. NPDC051770 TaxID=3155413 RepID=UPI00342CDA32
MPRHFILGAVVLLAAVGCAPGAHSADLPQEPADDLTTILSGALPDGIVGNISPAGKDLVRYDDGSGAVVLQVSVRRLLREFLDQATLCPPLSQGPYDQCVRTTEPDGAYVTVNQGFAEAKNPAGIQRWSATLGTPEGGIVALTEWNAPTPGSTGASRPHPPLTPEQLRSIVTAPAWERAWTRLAEPPTPPAAPSRGNLDPEQILDVLRQHVRPPLEITRTYAGGPGYVEATVNSTGGPTLVTITVQHWTDPSALTALVTKSRRRPDGTQLATHHQKLPTGATQDDLDVFTPTGTRILITQLNAAAPGLPPTSKSGPLTTPQQTALAETLLHQTS